MKVYAPSLYPHAAAAAPAAGLAPSAAAIDAFASAMAGAAPAQPASGAGPELMQQIDHWQQQLHAHWDQLQALGSTAPPGPGALLSAQALLAQTSFELELGSKVVSKSEQNIEQLVKMQ